MISLINFCLFCPNFWTRNVRKSIKPFKVLYSSLESKKFWTTKSDGLFDSQGMMSSSKYKQICINILSLCKHQQKTRDLEILNSSLARDLKQLSSSFWQQVTAIYGSGCFSPSLAFVGAQFFTNFGSRYARKPIKDSKDSDDSLDSKN